MEYKTIEVDYVEYGHNKFLEVSKKQIVGSGNTTTGNVFLNISKGYYTPEGERRYQRGIGLPDDRAIIEQLIEKMRGIVSESVAEDESAGKTDEKEE